MAKTLENDCLFLKCTLSSPILITLQQIRIVYVRKHLFPDTVSMQYKRARKYIKFKKS